jgi:hypothetical protein
MEENQVQVNPIKFWKQVVLSINAQLEVMSTELSKVQKSFPADGNAGGNAEKKAAQVAFQDLVENVKMLNAITAQSEASIAGIISNPSQLEYLRVQLADMSVVAVNCNELLSCINKLEYMLSAEYKYLNVARLMELINAELLHLEVFGNVSRIAALRKRRDAIKGMLRKVIFREFRDLGQLTDLDDRLKKVRSTSSVGKSQGAIRDRSESDGASSVQSAGSKANVNPLETLQDAHRVVTAMGEESVVDLMEQVCQIQLTAYDKVGGFGGFLHSLHPDALEKRWTGLRKLVHVAETTMSDICPPHWYFAQRLYLEFALRTKQHFADLLQAAEVQENLDEKDHVALLMSSLKSVLKIEEEMTARFDEACTSLSASDEVEELLSQIGQGNVMSAMFDDFMGPYVMLERRNLETMIRNLASQDNAALASNIAASLADAKGKESIAMHYESAPRMFEAIKGSMKRCIALTTGQPFVSLSMQYRNCIALYANALKARCPDPIQGVKGPGQSGLTYRITPESEMLICRVISTAEYCGEVVPQMENLIKEKVHPWLADKVNLTEQGDVFNDLAAHAIGILVSGICDKVEEPFKAMRKIEWQRSSEIGDSSPYCWAIKNVISEAMPRYKISLSATYFRNFATKVALAVLLRFEAIVLSRKRICTSGAEQLHLDIMALLNLMKVIHNIGTPEGSTRVTPVPTAHVTVVLNQANRTINILKIISVDENQVETMFKLLFPTGDAALLSNIQQLKSGRDVLSSTVDAVGSVGGKIGDTTKHAVGATIGGTTKAMGAVGQGTTKAFTAVGGGTSKAFSAVGGGTKHAFTAVGDGFGSVGESTKNAFEKVGDKTMASFRKNSLIFKKPFAKFQSPKKDEEDC